MVPHRLTAFVTRLLLLFVFWLMLLNPESFSPTAIGVDLAVGVLAAAAASGLSLRLLPPIRPMPRPWGLFRLLLRFLMQSLAGGLSVALRAFYPRLRLAPGFIRHPTQLPPGSARALFGALTSQVPGTLAIASDRLGELQYHCLNPHQGVEPGLANDETLFRAALGAVEPKRREGEE
jgi:multicomponent Na+:H+ antiporter subunit E